MCCAARWASSKPRYSISCDGRETWFVLGQRTVQTAKAIATRTDHERAESVKTITIARTGRFLGVKPAAFQAIPPPNFTFQ